jgi:hypothetical protein
MERTIVQQINTTLTADCIADLINEDTGLLLEGTMPEIIQTLFDTHGTKNLPPPRPNQTSPLTPSTPNRSLPFSLSSVTAPSWPIEPKQRRPHPNSSISGSSHLLAQLSAPATSESGTKSLTLARHGLCSRNIWKQLKKLSSAISPLSPPTR